VLVVVASVVLYRGVMFAPVDQGSVDTVVHAVDAQSVALRLSQAIRFATVSQQPPTPTDVGVTPGLTIAGTDSKHYETVADNAYRFNPMKLTSDDLPGIHGTDERVSIENLVRATRFYIELIKGGAGGDDDRR